MRRVSKTDKRVVVILALIIVGVPVLLGGVAYLTKPAGPPSVADAPWQVQTSSRVYYAKVYEIVAKSPAITGYWVLESRGWQFHKETFILRKELFGNVAIVRRVK